ncbi:FAD-binding oxidoreductase [Chitinivorax sp. PXF-14]|uniref:FAD-binding oxidoreductase n=1 Tax=Chitinivorax sp. PXF-14 TaxID=3230488 RepID=UPI0034678ABF
MTDTPRLPPGFIASLCSLLGERAVLRDSNTMAPYCIDQRQRYSGPALAVLLPASVEQVQGIVALTRAAGVAIVPQGGNTGLVGGATPLAGGPACVVLSTARMKAVRAWQDDTITVEAGLILDELNQLVAGRGQFLPIDLASSGSAQIGGLIATNAGGMRVIRYGMMRRQVLGLEAVLPSGELWSDLRPLLKNNSGYDLKQLLIGSEGTLGLVTAATLRLAPLPAHTATAFVALPSVAAGLRLLAALREHVAEWLSAFELISEPCLRLVRAAEPRLQAPVAFDQPWYALVEASGSVDETALQAALLAAFEQAGLAQAAIAQSQAQTDTLWRWREQIPAAQKHAGGNIKHDIGVPSAALPEFVAAADAALRSRFPGVEIIAFGHAGDGNLHYNVARTRDKPADTFLDEAEVNAIVYREVARVGGTPSAEHGVGQLKRGLLPAWAGETGMQWMRSIKATLDPDGLFNPGKLL